MSWYFWLFSLFYKSNGRICQILCEVDCSIEFIRLLYTIMRWKYFWRSIHIFYIFLTFISFWSAFYVKTLSLFTFATLNTIIFSTLKNQVKSQEHECSLEFYMRSKAYPVLPNDSKNPNFSDLSLAYLSYTGMRSSTPIRS